MSKHSTICTVRHGQTDFNIQKRYAGSLDVQLNAVGIKDTVEAAKTLSLLGLNIRAIICSALHRSIQTAEILSNGLPIIQCSLANERNFGEMQGKTVDQVKLMNPPIEYLHAGNDTHSLNPPGGESFPELRHRAEKFYDFLSQHRGDFGILVVSHGVFLQQFHGVILNRTWEESLEFEVPNLTLTCFAFSDGALTGMTTHQLCAKSQNSW
ncbi:histidine phosphatase family protein [Dehalogenimonas etheniformans]|uniref:Histidine phosphatase family protein n=1 Tax=Dehalogenimonas etheniformans TaxID=1536648 RepID=A0A2P5P6A5_9CHLR|nr:histidine phosphatase family protein [Dehalogenimonas etheniformans]PPD57810.1 histidine phosphatase family protein [Dehalogenimonas etheniformans]QNT76151.1 histidine phosphatase family protein [Dehalogenimonas etheniformans]